MTLGVIGKNLGMTQVFDEQGLAIPVTVIKVEPLTVTQIKTVDTDGYNAIQTGVVAAKEKHLTKAEIGHFAKNKLENFRHLEEYMVDNPESFEIGQKAFKRKRYHYNKTFRGQNQFRGSTKTNKGDYK